MSDWERREFSYYQRIPWGKLLLSIAVIVGIPLVSYYAGGMSELILALSFEVAGLAFFAELYRERYHVWRRIWEKRENWYREKLKEMEDQQKETKT